MIENISHRLSTAQEEAGQTMAEYAVVLGVITLAVVAALTALSGSVSTYLGSVTARI